MLKTLRDVENFMDSAHEPHRKRLKPVLDGETLKIKVRYFTTLRELAGTEEEELEMEDGGEALGDLNGEGAVQTP